MGLKIKEGYWDIYSIIFLSTFFTLMILIFPDFELIRIFLGILFLLFFPGYLTTSVIWPMKFDESDSEEEDYEETLEDDYANSNLNGKKEKSIDGPTRLALSVGLSLGITPVIAFIFNEMYVINENIFGLRLIPILLAIYFYIMLISGIAIWRREKLPKKKRLLFSFEIKAPFDKTIQDRVITTTLIVLIIISGSIGIYLYKYYHENEKYTEFYILGPDKKISDYPRNIYVNEEKIVFIGINNKEYKEVNYEIMIFLNSKVNLKEVDNFNNIQLSPNSAFLYKENIKHNEEFQSPIYFKINQSGKFDLNLHLIKDGEVYRKLVLKLAVFLEKDMIVNQTEKFKFFILSPEGLPGGFPSVMDSNYPLELLFGIENQGDFELNLNISISTNDPDRWFYDVDRTFPLINKTGYYFFINVHPRREVTSTLDIDIPEGNWILYFNVNGLDSDSIRKEIYVH